MICDLRLDNYIYRCVYFPRRIGFHLAKENKRSSDSFLDSFPQIDKGAFTIEKLNSEIGRFVEE